MSAESEDTFRDQPDTCRNRESHGKTPSRCPWCGYDPLGWRMTSPPKGSTDV